MVHVDDVARAHIFLLESSTAKGRYICSSDLLTNEQMPEFLSARYPEFQIPTPE
jgi:nucleoside-diphosphate-sugar epimerase